MKPSTTPGGPGRHAGAPWIFLPIALLVGFRFYLATRPYSAMMGFNEAYYALSARNLEWATLTPIVCLGEACRPHLKLPPLTSLLIAALPVGEFWSRLPSLAAWVGCLIIAYRLRGTWAMLLVAFAPWMYLWMGRAQTDPPLVFFILLTVYGLDRGKPWAWVLGLMGGLLTKQTYLLAFPLFLYREWWTWRNLGLAVLALVPSLAWWTVQVKHHPQIFLEDLQFHATGRQGTFAEAWAEVLALGFIFALGPFLAQLRPYPGPIRALSGPRWVPSRVAASALLFALFALVNAPYSHSYYTLPAIALASLLITPPRPLWARFIPPVAVAMSLVLVGLGGELDRPILHEALSELPPGAYVQASLWPQAEYYHADYRVEGDSCPIQPNRTILCAQPSPGCVNLHVYRGYFDRLYLQRCP